MSSIWVISLTIQLLVVGSLLCVQGEELDVVKHEKDAILQSDDASNKTPLEPRIGDRSFVKDIVERLHALDNDIGKLLYNSTSMYSPNDEVIARQNPKGSGQKFTEILNDLDSLQDEVSL